MATTEHRRRSRPGVHFAGARRGVELAFIRPGKPVENAYIESFHSRFRDECLSAHWSLDIADARFQIEHFRWDYNEARPDSRLDNRAPAEFTAAFHQATTITQRLSA